MDFENYHDHLSVTHGEALPIEHHLQEMLFSINLESPLCQEIFNTSYYMTSYFPQF